MARTIIGSTTPKRSSGSLVCWHTTPVKSYFDQRFVGAGAEAKYPFRLSPIWSDAGIRSRLTSLR